MKTLLGGIFVVGVLAVGISTSSVGASNGFRPSGIIPHSGSKPTLHPVRNTSGTFTCGGITCSAYETGVNTFLQDVAHDSGGSNNVYSVDTEYSDGTGSIAYNETFGGSYIDTNAYPANACTTGASVCLTGSQLVTEMTSDLTAKSWATGATNLFVILLPESVDTCFDTNTNDGCASNAFCAYHSASGSLIYAVEPFNASFICSGAGELSNPQGFPNGPEIDETVNTTSHEANEAITDPTVGGGWWSSQGNEIGDLCAWWFGAAAGTAANGQPYNQVINGHDYSLQQEFSNAANLGAGGCLQHPGGTASTASPYLQTPDSGPLVYHGGSVMRSVNVYTIYWIPAATPLLSTSPVVTGTDAVGHQLSTTNGTWTNSPTSYQYKWQRCSNAGVNCVDIATATSSQYTLTAADAGHTILAEVLASNAAGPAANGYETSAVTNAVIGKPTVQTAPKLSGTAKLGRRLTVGKGAWTYSPTSYAYQWLRCTAAGRSCKNIGAATKSSYKATSADVGHKLEAKVTAMNIAGSGSATSGKSSTVVK